MTDLRPPRDPAGKTLGEMKAEPMDDSKFDRWLSGKISRRVLVAPYYGPAKATNFIGYPADGIGRDLDGEYFHPEDAQGPATDFYGPFPALRTTRQRIVDWHHVTFGGQEDPVGNRTKGAILGHIVLDDEAEDDGLWADFWANAGEKRRKLMATLERDRGIPLFGSTQPVATGIVKGKFGRIDQWPIRFHTISTSPQNTWAVMPSLKAMVDDGYSLDEIPADALKALLVGLDASTTELLLSSSVSAVNASDPAGDAAVKAGRVLSSKNEARLRAILDELTAHIALMRGPDPADPDEGNP